MKAIRYLLCVLLVSIFLAPSSIKAETTTIADLQGGAKTGDILVMGEYDGTPIQWRVMNTNETGDGRYLITDKILFNSKFGDSVNYEDSLIRDYLTSDFLLGFIDDELAYVQDTTYSTIDPSTGSYYELADKFYLLSYTEAGFGSDANEGSNIGFTSNADRIAYRQDNNQAYYWWLRTPYSTSYVYYVGTGGGWSNYFPSDAYGVRPACAIDIDTPVELEDDGYYHIKTPTSTEVSNAESQTEYVEIYADLDSYYSVRLPKKVNVQSEYSDFTIYTKGNLAATDALTIDVKGEGAKLENIVSGGTPKPDVPLEISSSKERFTFQDIGFDYELNDRTAASNAIVTITHDPLDPGSWRTDLDINISLGPSE